LNRRRRGPAAARLTLAAALGVAAAAALAPACARRGAGAAVGGARGGEVDLAPPAEPRSAGLGGRVVRVALAESAERPRVSATFAWTLGDADGARVLARGDANAEWAVERRGDQLRVLGPAGGTSWSAGPLVVRTVPGAFVTFGGRRYRGELWLHPAAAAGGVAVVDRLAAEDYLRGVVPLELPGEGPADLAALQAQAVAARSYTYSRLAEFLPRSTAVAQARLPFDLRATVRDQVYGGRDAERAGSDQAVISTAGLVLRYDGAVVSAPYHAACGGTTAAPDELWGEAPAPYLRPVSDRVPGTERAYCDASPRQRWTREWDRAELDRVIAQYLRTSGQARAGAPLDVRAVDVVTRTASGRAGALAVRTGGGAYVLRGNAIRYALRGRGGDILPSTYFTAAAEPDGSGRVARLVVRGGGNGHGVGMCQWGAMGRARAGQDFRTILRTYYPGTTVEPVE
jgi:stage II sporulation protein D